MNGWDFTLNYWRRTAPSVRWAATALMLLIISACGVNPVTGQRELSLISESEEIALGEQHYGPTKQSEGGELTVDAELTAYVNEVGQRVAAFSPRELPYEFVVLNNSVPNAWALPGGKIAVNRGLLYELNNEAELAAVLGHEVVHSAARHGAQSMERGMLMQGALMATAIAASSNEYAGIIVGGAQVGAQLISQGYGREAEREADLYGTRYLAQAGYDPQAAVSLQEAFVRLSNGREPGWLDGLFASHPPSMERVRNNQQLVAQLRSEGFTEGELGEERYQQRTALLRDTRQAYEALDEAQALLAQNQPDAALQRVDAAIALFPREPRFYGLKADIALSQDRPDEAVRLYNEAISRHDGYFDYYLGRGLAYSRQGNAQRAQADLRASAELLPTALAMNELGTMALAANDRTNAKAYFQQAATAPGAMGQQAQAAFMRLDVVDNPGNYLQTAAHLSNDGRVLIRVQNRSPVTLSQVRMEVQAVIGGERVSRQVTLQSLASGQTGDVDSGLRATANAPLGGAQVVVQGASVEQ